MGHLEGTFKGYQNLDLYYQGWLPAAEPKAVLIVNHGLAEHSGRYADLAAYLMTRGYAVYSFDHYGHGKSPGLRGYVDDFTHFVNDLGAFRDLVRQKHRRGKIFIIAHSVGGTIATAYTINHQNNFDGLILSGATLKAGASVPAGLIWISPLLSLLIPKVGLYTIDSTAISHDPAVVAVYVNDPLVYNGKIRTRLGIEIIKTMQHLPSEMSKIHLPILILHGTADRLSEPQGSRMLYDRVKSADKTLKLYDGLFHEIFNEPEREKIFADVEKWLAERV